MQILVIRWKPEIQFTLVNDFQLGQKPKMSVEEENKMIHA